MPRSPGLGVSYRSVLYASILVSGASALVCQVVWQRYLSYLVGSEGRSSALVVMLFLLGLASGYRFWGNQTQRHPDRQGLFKLCALAELGIALYALAFPVFFPALISLARTLPDSLVWDLAIAALVVFPPTFLMGSTIPLLTTALPESLDEATDCHARIYGINTLGAFGGAMLGGFVLIPELGLSGALSVAGAADLAVAFVLFGAPFLGPIAGKAVLIAPLRLRRNSQNRASGRLLDALVFATGAATLCLELVFLRLLGLATGPGPYLFAVGAGTFVLGLGAGSVLVAGKASRSRADPPSMLRRALLLALAWFTAIYFTVPYWPYWFSLIRVSLPSEAASYAVHQAWILAFAIALSMPGLIFLGRVLPMAYAWIEKTRENYGRLCGRLYFFNTLGTAVGALVLGHLALEVVDLDGAYAACLLLLAASALALLLRAGKKREAAALLAGVIALALLPRWDRAAHRIGLYRVHERRAFHFSGVFVAPALGGAERADFFDDGPSETVAVLSHLTRDGLGHPVASRSLTINGKVDGNSHSDYSTFALSATLPYLYGPERSGLDAVVIGLGTGVTAGILARLDGIRSTEVLEISPTVLKAAPWFDAHNEGLTHNPKASLRRADAFRYFGRSKRFFDLIVSEPSNPWIAGVENLFTPEFYELVSRSLARDGVFLQWIQGYEMTTELYAALLAGVSRVFPHVSVFQTAQLDYAVLASFRPLAKENGSGLRKRFREPAVAYVHARLGLMEPEQLAFLRIYDVPKGLFTGHPFPPHHLDRPTLGYAADRARFLGRLADPLALFDPDTAAALAELSDRSAPMQAFLERYPKGFPPCTKQAFTTDLLCLKFEQYRADRERVRAASLAPATDLGETLLAYRELRRRGALPANRSFLVTLRDRLLEKSLNLREEDRRNLAGALCVEVARDRLWAEAAHCPKAFQENGLFSPEDVTVVLQKVAQIQAKAGIRTEITSASQTRQ